MYEHLCITTVQGSRDKLPLDGSQSLSRDRWTINQVAATLRWSSRGLLLDHLSVLMCWANGWCAHTSSLIQYNPVTSSNITPYWKPTCWGRNEAPARALLGSSYGEWSLSPSTIGDVEELTAIDGRREAAHLLISVPCHWPPHLHPTQQIHVFRNNPDCTRDLLLNDHLRGEI